MNSIIPMAVLLIFTVPAIGQITTAENGLNSPTATSVRLGGPLLQNTNIDLGSSYDFNFLKGSNNQFSILNNGNVGIGTGSPSARFHIYSATDAPAFRIQNAGYAAEYKQVGYNTTVEAVSNFILHWGPQQTRSEMFLQSSATSAGKFFVSQNYGAFVNGFSGFRVATNEMFGFFTHGSSTPYNAIGAVWVNNSNAGLAFYTKNDAIQVQAAQFSKAGNLLIGTTTDAGNKLQVNGIVSATGLKIATSAGAGKVLTSDAGGNATWQDAPASGNSWSLAGNDVNAVSKLGNITAQDLNIITSNISRIYVKASGSVGIGTENINDNYKLWVNGYIRTRKVRVDQSTWPDYVFENGYTLRPLHELEQFIQKNKHLPDVPPAAEVEKEGVDLGDNQAVLLKKIEELTLYVIQLQKQIAVQQQRIDMLEEKTPSGNQ